MPPLKHSKDRSDMDICKCGDMRFDHKDGVGPCRHNKPRDFPHGYEDCMEFRLAKQHVAEDSNVY